MWIIENTVLSQVGLSVVNYFLFFNFFAKTKENIRFNEYNDVSGQERTFAKCSAYFV